MAYIKDVDRHQVSMPECLEDMISQDNPVRVIDAFVDMLDMATLGFKKEKPAVTGRPAYDPRTLLKLYIYGYFNALRSSRRLMRECTRNIELFFLLSNLRPDFRTISDFRKENKEAIRNTFCEFTQVCMFLKLYDEKELLAIDGSKFRAVNGNKKMFNKEILEKKLQRIREKSNQYLEALSEADKFEDDSEKTETIDSLQQKLELLNQKETTYEAWKNELKESGEKQKLTTDPEARMMYTPRGGYTCSYNVQTAVSAGSHFIVDYQVSNHVNDQGLLHDFCETIKDNIGMKAISVVADKGYDCKEELLLCLMDGTIPYVGFKDDKGERLYSIQYIPREITEQQQKSLDSKDIKACLNAGVLPSCYEGKHITLEVHTIGEIGAFTRGEDKSYVTCPMGFRLNKTKDKNGGMV